MNKKLAVMNAYTDIVVIGLCIHIRSIIVEIRKLEEKGHSCVVVTERGPSSYTPFSTVKYRDLKSIVNVLFLICYNYRLEYPYSIGQILK